MPLGHLYSCLFIASALAHLGALHDDGFCCLCLEVSCFFRVWTESMSLRNIPSEISSWKIRSLLIALRVPGCTLPSSFYPPFWLFVWVTVVRITGPFPSLKHSASKQSLFEPANFNKSGWNAQIPLPAFCTFPGPCWGKKILFLHRWFRVFLTHISSCIFTLSHRCRGGIRHP